MVVIEPIGLNKEDYESDFDYISRICENKSEYNLTWNDVAFHINKNLNQNYSESFYRKHFYNGDFSIVYDAECTNVDSDSQLDVDEIDEYIDYIEDQYNELDNKLLEVQKERVKLSDYVTQNNAYIRRLSREDTLKDIAHDYALKMSTKRLLPDEFKHVDPCFEYEGILLLSDWHYGMICDNPWNIFNEDVCKKRVNTLLNKTISIVRKNNIHKMTVLNLSDLIAGRIHTQIRIESRIDVISQVMQVSEILAEFLSSLSKYCVIDYYDCLDNHSRLEPNKKESMDLESLVRVIPWYLKERLADNSAIKICDNEFGADIITCKVAGHDIIGVHGDNDRPTNALERLSLMTHRHYSMLCTAHLHHFSADEQHQSVVISNSSLMGVDRYAEKLRLTSDPSQTLVLASKENVCEVIYRIKLN